MLQGMRRVALLLAGLAAASPAFAIQEVTLGPRAPSIAAAADGVSWAPLALPAPLSGGLAAPEAPGSWAFTGGETTRLGSIFFNVTEGPSWSMRHGPLGAFTGFDNLSLGRPDFGWTTRQTTGVLATDRLMLYTSVGRTTYGSGASLVPLPPGLSLLEQPYQRMDVRAGFKMELMPGLTFGMEAGVQPAMR